MKRLVILTASAFLWAVPASQGAVAVTFGPQPGRETNVSGDANSHETEAFAAAAGNSLVATSTAEIRECFELTLIRPLDACAPKIFTSTDGGRTFSVKRTPLHVGTSVFGVGLNPVLDYDKNGNFYLQYLLADSNVFSLKWATANITSNDGGRTWSAARRVAQTTLPTAVDKPMIAVDRSHTAFANRVYVAYTTIGLGLTNSFRIDIQSSVDGGATWSPATKVNDSPAAEAVIFAFPAVDHRTGGLNMVWHNGTQNRIIFDRSVDGAKSWGTDKVVATTRTGVQATIGCNGGKGVTPANTLKVGASGTLYVTYTDLTSENGLDILFTKSTDGGSTWSTPRVLNDDGTGAHQYLAFLSAQPNGSGGDKLTATFYDRRDDPNNCLTHRYATQSMDGGASWSPNVRLTTAPSNFDGNQRGPGGYTGSTPFNGAVWDFFSDHRAGQPSFDLYTVPVS